MISKFIYNTKAACTKWKAQLKRITLSFYNKLRKTILWTECETQEEIYRYWKRLGVTVLSSIASTCGLWLTASTASPVVSGMLIAGLNAAGVQCLKNLWESALESDVILMNYAKTFGLNFLAGSISFGAAIYMTAKIAGVCCASVPAVSVTYLQYVALKAVSCAISGFVFSLASDVGKKYVSGVYLTCTQFGSNALEKALQLGGFGIVSGLMSNVVGLFSGERIVPVTCKIARKVTEKITETTLGLCASYVTPYAERIFQRVLSFIGQSTEHLKRKVYHYINLGTSHS